MKKCLIVFIVLMITATSAFATPTKYTVSSAIVKDPLTSKWLVTFKVKMYDTVLQSAYVNPFLTRAVVADPANSDPTVASPSTLAYNAALNNTGETACTVIFPEGYFANAYQYMINETLNVAKTYFTVKGVTATTSIGTYTWYNADAKKADYAPDLAKETIIIGTSNCTNNTPIDVVLTDVTNAVTSLESSLSTGSMQYTLHMALDRLEGAANKINE